MQDLKWILDALPIGVWVGSVPGARVVYANPAFRTILGMGAASESTIDDASTIYGIFDRQGEPYPADELPFSRVMASGEAATVDDMVIHRPDGQKINLRAFACPTFDAERRLSHVIVAFIDITKEVKAEVERQESEARLALAVNHAPIAIWATDSDGLIKVSEGAGLAALGVKSGQLVGMNIFELYKDHPTIPGYVRRGLEGEAFWYTVEVGEAIYDTWLAPVRDASGDITGTVGLSNDVSEIRRLQANAIQNDRAIALGTLAASFAHEINNPLTYMLGHASLLNDTLERVDRTLLSLEAPSAIDLRVALGTMRRMLGPIHEGTERIGAITRDLLTFSRPDVDDITAVDVRAVVESILKLVGKDLEARARLNVDLGETAAVRANHARLGQVTLNLVVNAMQALPAESPELNQVDVSTRSVGSEVVIEVGDNGRGVLRADRERIFDPFFSTKALGEGTGLGLFVCRNIARGFSGDVTVVEREGGGAVFRVTLPAMPLATVPASIPGPVVPLATAKRVGSVLVIDDEPLIGRLLCEQLEAAGYRAACEDDAERGLDHLKRSGGNIDLVYCDLMMRGMTGMDLADALELERPAVRQKMVFMTGGAFTPQAQAFVDRHGDDVVQKPFDVVRETDRRMAGRGV